jgi:flagellar protein FlgJ
MDIAGIGAMYLNDFQAGGGIVNRDNMANGTPDFEDLLRKSADANAANPQGGIAAPPLPDAAKPHPHSPSPIDKTDKLYEQCLELEIFLVKTLVNSMRNTVQKSGLINEGFAGKMYEDMLYDEYARNLTKNASFGMAELAYRELTNQR